MRESPITKKIKRLVKAGNTEMAFRHAKNYDTFAREWKKRGREVRFLKSSGPVVEGGYRRNAWYGVATKEKMKKKNPVNSMFFDNERF